KAQPERVEEIALAAIPRPHQADIKPANGVGLRVKAIRGTQAEAEGVVVGRADRKDRKGHVRPTRAEQTVGDFMDRPVAARRGYHVVAGPRRFERQFLGMERALGRPKVGACAEDAAELFDALWRATARGRGVVYHAHLHEVILRAGTPQARRLAYGLEST